MEHSVSEDIHLKDSAGLRYQTARRLPLPRVASDEDWGRSAGRDLAALLEAPRGRQHRRLCRGGRGGLEQPSPASGWRRPHGQIGGPLPNYSETRVPMIVTGHRGCKRAGGQIWTRISARRDGFPQVDHSGQALRWSDRARGICSASASEDGARDRGRARGAGVSQQAGYSLQPGPWSGCCRSNWLTPEVTSP